jgi:predicted metal-dependent hydrolase
MIPKDQAAEELNRVVQRQQKDLKSRLDSFSKGSLKRMVKILGGGLGDNVTLQGNEQKFLDDLHNYFENHLANAGLKDELANEGEQNG